MALILTGLSACSQNNASAVYDNSVDVPLLGWASADTLFYPLVVADPVTIKNPIALHHRYQLSAGIRYSSRYPLITVPALLLLQQTDTTGGFEHPVRNLLRQELSLAVRDSAGIPLGNTWGSLISYQTAVPDVAIHFDSAGTYRFLLIPELGDLNTLPGLASISLRLE